MKNLRKTIVGLLAVMLITSSVPVTALADEINEDAASEADVAIEETVLEDTDEAEITEEVIESEDVFDETTEDEVEAEEAEETEEAEVVSESEETDEVEAEEVEEVTEDEDSVPVLVETEDTDVSMLANPINEKIGDNVYSECLDLSGDGIPETMIISGQGKMYANENSSIPWTGKIEKVIIEYGVTNIKPNAFLYYEDLKSVIISSSVTTIGKSAFAGCSSLQSIAVPNSVTTIGAYAFADCSNLKTITLSSNLKTLSEGLFARSGLTSFKIPDTVTTLESGVFIDCKNLSSITIPKTITEIPELTFSDTGFTSFTVPSHIKSIGSTSFSVCKKLTSVTIPSSVKTIGRNAFAYDEALKTVNIANGVTTIDYAAFSGCTALETFNIPTSVTTLGTYTFNRCVSLKSITIPSGIKTIPQNCFHDCYSLEDVKIPEGVTKIDEYAFLNCESLRTISFPNSLNTLKGTAFNNCTNLSTVIAPCGFGFAIAGGPTIVFRHFYDNENDTTCNKCFAQDKTAAFATRLYTTCLGRAAEPNGRTYWINQLRAGKSGAEAAYKFFFGDEFTSKNYSNDEFIKRLYRTFMNREADNNGLTYWKNQMAKGATRLDVFNGFVKSAEWKTVCRNYSINPGVPNERIVSKAEQFATRLYTTCLGRTGDEAGIAYWTEQLRMRKTNGPLAAYSFFFGKEFTSRNYSNDEFIKRLYKTCLNREADANGLTYWRTQFANGKTRLQVFNSFVQSSEFQSVCANYGITYRYPYDEH